ncbi:hypothetical protein Esti_003788 [Eimeria stiedai]
MKFCTTTAPWLALVGFCLVALRLTDHGVNAARLAATRAARQEAAAKLNEAKTPEEIQKEKERLLQVQDRIADLLKDSKEYRQAQLKKKQQEEAAQFSPEDLESSELWRKEYEEFMKAELGKERWEQAGIVSAVGSAVAAGLAAFGKAHENSGGVSQNPSAARLVRGAGTAALVTGAAALFSWLMRRHNRKLQKLHNARLARMQFEARTGLKPSDENVLGPDEEEILNPKKKETPKEEDRLQCNPRGSAAPLDFPLSPWGPVNSVCKTLHTILDNPQSVLGGSKSLSWGRAGVKLFNAAYQSLVMALLVKSYLQMTSLTSKHPSEGAVAGCDWKLFFKAALCWRGWLNKKTQHPGCYSLPVGSCMEQFSSILGRTDENDGLTPKLSREPPNFFLRSKCIIVANGQVQIERFGVLYRTRCALKRSAWLLFPSALAFHYLCLFSHIFLFEYTQPQEQLSKKRVFAGKQGHVLRLAPSPLKRSSSFVQRVRRLKQRHRRPSNTLGEYTLLRTALTRDSKESRWWRWGPPSLLQKTCSTQSLSLVWRQRPSELQCGDTIPLWTASPKTFLQAQWELFQRGVGKSAEGPCLGTRQKLSDGKMGEYKHNVCGLEVNFKSVSVVSSCGVLFTQVERLALEVGSGLLNGDMVPQRTFDSGAGKSLTLRCIGIFAKNREEWVITEHACNAYGFTVVPLYDTLGPHSTRFILEETQMKSVVCDDSCLAKLLNALQEDRAEDSGGNKNRLPVKYIVALDDIPEAQKKQAADLNLELVPWEVLLEKGRANMVPLSDAQQPTLETLSTICYTSGRSTHRVFLV